MVNRKMTADQALSLTRRLARKKGYQVQEIASQQGKSRGKGSHKIQALCDSSGAELVRFGVTGHGSRDMSWDLLTRLEQALEPYLGEKWTEKR